MRTAIEQGLEYPFDPDWLIRKKKSIRRELLNREIDWIDKRIAILGGSTTNDLQDFIEIFLLKEGIRPSFYASEYNRYWEDAMFDNPTLEEFQPDVILIHTTHHNISEWPSVLMEKDEINELLKRQFSKLQAMWERLNQKYKCPIIQNNFDRPFFRLLGNKDIYDCHGWSNFVFQLNGMLYHYAGQTEHLFVHDIDYLAARYGLDEWQDPQHWNLYKYAMQFKAIPEFAYSVTRIIKSIFGKNKKAVVVDLDNTLWGGVVGDDGVENLVIGPETPDGEAFSAFQSYLCQLKQMGILLAVDSKNDEANALAGLAHPNNLLHEGDFACIKANWLSKDQNMRVIAEKLNLGLDSLVFVDDNPAERDLIRSQVTAVSVPEVGEEETYGRILDHAGYFEVTSLTLDDLRRNEMYQANAKRIQVQQDFKDYGAYLRSLEMRAVIRDFEAIDLPRIAQLVNKTNQFNLTAKRFSEAEITSISLDNNYIRLCGRLEDKFGDNGIVSVLLGQQSGEKLKITLWLMSCRVLKRDLEYAMFDCLVEECCKRGIEMINGFYRPTVKNSMVRTLYDDMGFQKVSEDKDGKTVWEYLVKGHVSKNNSIELIR